MENKKEIKAITRSESLKKCSKVVLAAGTMLLLLNSPKKALASSDVGHPGPRGAGDGF